MLLNASWTISELFWNNSCAFAVASLVAFTDMATACSACSMALRASAALWAATFAVELDSSVIMPVNRANCSSEIAGTASLMYDVLEPIVQEEEVPGGAEMWGGDEVENGYTLLRKNPPPLHPRCARIRYTVIV